MKKINKTSNYLTNNRFCQEGKFFPHYNVLHSFTATMTVTAMKDSHRSLQILCKTRRERRVDDILLDSKT